MSAFQDHPPDPREYLPPPPQDDKYIVVVEPTRPGTFIHVGVFDNEYYAHAFIVRHGLERKAWVSPLVAPEAW